MEESMKTLEERAAYLGDMGLHLIDNVRKIEMQILIKDQQARIQELGKCLKGEEDEKSL